MSDTKTPAERLNSMTLVSIRKAGTREKALEFLELTMKYSDNNNLVNAVRKRLPFKSKSEASQTWFDYLMDMVAVIDELYPPPSTA